MNTKVHLLITGGRVACQEVPYSAYATRNPMLVTCLKCERTHMYDAAVKVYANRKSHRKARVFQKGLFDNE